MIGLQLGAAIGALVGGVTRGNPSGGLVVGSLFALLVVGLLVAHDVRAGAMGVPRRRPFRLGDRFMGWTVAGRLRTGFDHTVDYEVRHGDLRGRLTVLLVDPDEPRDVDRRLPHPLDGIGSRHLVQPLDIGRAGHLEYVVTELDRSESLAARVTRGGHLSDEALFRVAAGIALALKDVHAREAAHGRVRPDQVAVSDARVALYAFDPLARCHGVEAYAAPEQDDLGTAEADVYSWASTVYFAATGRPPGDEPDLSGLPRWLHPILRDALAEEPARRPDAAAVVEQLRAVGDEHGWQLIHPDSPPPPVRPLPWAPARATAVVVASLVLAAVLPTLVPSAPGTAAAGVPTDTTSATSTTSETAATTTTEATPSPATPASTTLAPPPTVPPPTETPSTADPAAEAGWPVDAADGSPAFTAYLGSTFLVPRWVACAAGHCVVGSGDQVYLFTEQPIVQIGQIGADVPDPGSALTAMGLTSAQATSLLER